MFSEASKNYLKTKLEELGIPYENFQLEALELLYVELLKWNEHTNLTRITEENDFVLKHILDSLTCIKAFNTVPDRLQIIDIGTGAGFPLLPLWLFFPNNKITLVDSVKKKLLFINHFVEIITQKEPAYKLSKVSVVHSRAEDLGQNKLHREKYDVSVNRAVASLNALSELCLPLVKKDGVMIAMKSMEIDEEVANAQTAIKTLGGKVQGIIKFDLFETDLKRSLVIVKKVRNTPSEFPRKAGIAQKQPL